MTKLLKQIRQATILDASEVYRNFTSFTVVGKVKYKRAGWLGASTGYVIVLRGKSTGKLYTLGASWLQYDNTIQEIKG